MIHRGKDHCFPDWATTERGVADVGDHNAWLAVDPFKERGPGGNICRAADQRIVGHDAKGGEEGVHRAAQPLVKTGAPGEDFGQRAIERVIERHFFETGPALVRLAKALNDPQRRAPHITFHDRLQRRIIQFVNRRKTLRQDLAVAAM